MRPIAVALAVQVAAGMGAVPDVECRHGPTWASGSLDELASRKVRCAAATAS